MRKIVFLDRATLAPQTRLRRPSFPHEWIDYARTSEADTIERARDASILVLNKARLSAEVLAELPNLRFVAVAATGYDCVDVEAAAARDVVVSNIRGYAKTTVPEHTFALILALSRSLAPYARDVLSGRWREAGQFCFFDHPIVDLAGKRLGVIGAGALGGRVAELGRAFGMDVAIVSPRAPKGDAGVVSFDELIETSEVISLHCPLNESTRGMFDASVFARMKRAPILVNTARAGLIVEEDLEWALDSGLVRAAALDVASPEPPPADSAFMRLAARPNVICTPHVAWASAEAQQALADQLIDNIENFVAGTPTNVVTAGA
jgi:glycerate dehydrogenase